ncbi:hypothetical protein CJ255_09330 [Candidatus Viridilinea mediisalina]|uniref:SH3b domain-containing protein n=2 Tax=Candidatus Viridilinea mediisalina TaxID=2024553 RepID=A0A2A6RKE4_9CHLR|nr:hypothetical protein CJ255_09330 [Candidatus Viridilinea mediisalina]
MRSMNDQLSSKTKEIADLEKQLAASSKQAAAGDEAKKKLAETQEQVRKMQLEVAKLQIEAQTAQNRARQAVQAAEQAAAEAANADTEPAGAAAGSSVAAPPELAVGVSAWVRKAGGMNLRLRDRPGLQSNAFAGLPPGTQMTMLEGPVPLDNYPWWRVRVSDGREGWVAGSELVTQPED